MEKLYPPNGLEKMIYHSKCGLPVGLCVCPGAIQIIDESPEEPSAGETIRNLYRC